MIVYFDMDGVLADMYGFLSEKLSLPPDEIRTHSPEVCAQYLKFGYSYGWEGMFRDLPPLHLGDMKNMMGYLHKRGLEVEVLTAIASESGLPGVTQAAQCHLGKAQWLHRWYKEEIEEGVINRVNVVNSGVDKALYALSGGNRNLLIDDHITNTSKFEEAGGMSFLYRSHDEFTESRIMRLVGL